MAETMRNPNMNILLIAIILSLGVFGGLAIGLVSYGGYFTVAMILGAVVGLGTLVTLIMLLIYGSWKHKR